MEVLDTSIANVALPHIAGDLGASNDESTWVLTSYLASNAIVLPMGGWLASLFGRKRFFLLCILLFTLSSMLCGAAPNLGALILFRVLQGVGGGGLQPMAQAILADTFPPQQRGLAFALYGITAVTAPTIGPTLGGWITDSYSWRWIFYINLPVGLITMFLAYRMVEDPPYLKRAKAAVMRVDYLGIALLSLGVGALQILLDKGQEDDWFGSHFIVALIAISATCLISLVIWEWHFQAPDYRCPAVQVLQLRHRQSHDVHTGRHVIQQPGDDAPVSADAVGLYGTQLGAGSFRQRGSIADGNAHHGSTHDEIPGEIYRVVSAGCCLPWRCFIPPGEST